ncbi:hypothetical protein EZJ43_07975 [Pedobacter changchengzhani]|uniref:Uncharacterized protein n=1 Tax=Pedobacter changchengzhani TaxID=2529274 RepID=A0A4R5MLS6_9SPHI|nr:hypothetical protein [Pedobacter changchengzhani]TDG36446.1 hypothetical protein EZJ43_07975 [Pedobacter changchengzhani]
MKKIYLTILLLFTVVITYGQSFDVRKITLKSDVILFCNQKNVIDSSKIINDYSSNYFYKITAVDTIIKNKTGFVFQKAEIRVATQDEDYLVNVSNCAPAIGYPFEMNKSYYEILFLKKIGKQYQIIGLVKNNDSRAVWQKLIDDIKSVASLENLKVPTDRYSKTIDWFIGHGINPTADFLTYYKQQGILKTDIAVLTDKQLANALANFLAEKTELMPLITKKYPEVIRDHYLDKLKSIYGTADKYSYSDCSDFQEAVRILTNNFNDNYEDINYVATNLLTNELSYYEKGNIMSALIKVVEKGDYRMKL